MGTGVAQERFLQGMMEGQQHKESGPGCSLSSLTGEAVPAFPLPWQC